MLTNGYNEGVRLFEMEVSAMTELKQLFDETYGKDDDYSRTIWYGYIEEPLNDDLAEKLVSLMKKDLTVPQENEANATHWVFYGATAMDDALGEKVRSTLFVRLRDNDYVVNYSLGDFAFVMTYDETEMFRQLLLSKLGD